MRDRTANPTCGLQRPRAPPYGRAVRSHELVPASTWLLVELPVFVVAVVIALVVPLALAAAAVPSPMRRAGWIAGLAAAVGLVAIRTPGVFAVLSCVPFAGVAVAAGLLGLARLVAPPRTAARLALAVGLVFVPAPATWLLAHQSAIRCSGTRRSGCC